MTLTKAKKLREMFNKDGVIRLAGAHDGITAKLVELNGFDGVWAMNDAVSIPVVADCDRS